jgi:hypothetical protein
VVDDLDDHVLLQLLHVLLPPVLVSIVDGEVGIATTSCAAQSRMKTLAARMSDLAAAGAW